MNYRKIIGKNDSFFFFCLDTLFFEPTEDDDEDDEMFSVQCYHAKQKLQTLDTKITNKSQALDALRPSRKSDTKVN